MRILPCLCGVAIVSVSSGFALAADIGAGTVYQDPLWPRLVGPAPVSSWTGGYVGIQGGFGGGDITYPVSAPTVGISDDITMRSSGFFGGAQLGYNYQMDSVVIGVEGDIAASGIKSSAGLSVLAPGLTANGTAGTKLDYFGTVRARLGFLVTPTLLLYGTGGWAFGQTTSTAEGSIAGFGSASYSFTHTKSGWAAGGGLEYEITPNLTFKTEYLYVDLGTDQITAGTLFGVPYTIDETTKIHTIKAGLNFKFGAL